MNKKTRNQLIESSKGIKGDEIGPWLADALEYLQNDGDDDHDMASRVVFYALFLGRPKLVDDIILMQGSLYHRHITKSCAPTAKEVPLNDAIAYGRLLALTSPLEYEDEMEGINALINLCSKSPSVDVSIESIQVLRATFGDQLTDDNVELLRHFIETVPQALKRTDPEEAANLEKNLTTNITFGVFYAWSILERAELLEALG